MEIRNLITFTKVAEAQSLSKAAKELGYAQSTVTMQMQQLEQEMGVSLYERVGKQIRITREGQELLQIAAHIIKMSQEALQIGKGVSGTVDGSLRIGVLEAYAGEAFTEQLRQYHQKYPGVTLSVRTSRDSQELLGLLKHNEVDLVITLDVRLQDPMLVLFQEQREPVHFFVAPDHPLAGRTDILWEELEGQTWVRSYAGEAWEQELERELTRETTRKPVRKQARKPVQKPEQKPEQKPVQAGISRLEAGNIHLAARMAVRGLGIWLAPDCAAEEYVRDGRLTAADSRFCHMELWRQTVYHKNKWLTGTMNAWFDMQGDD